ncbi:hypothetical protein J31TS6_40400 [Brevibacillus reuszeri]|uniref:phage tail assembly protein n=1 Tax=Brevibacillus reuszeri TaxID=54915 RepID=UPI001B17ECC9|nr:phage tail assembly protein [Brevibacillus reuszeri]GIO08012.1 hypothetical protein J31TS6_40400 [Brevibacillus reuszeri]
MTENANTTPTTVDELVYKLRRPFVFDGQTFTELKLDFDSLTGNDLIECERKAAVRKDTSYMKETSKTYAAIVAARAANVPEEMVFKLPAKDFTRLTVLVQNFLLN